LLYTDGLVEAENASGESFGEAALPAFINEKWNCGTEQFVELLLREALVWSRDGPGKGQEDDITIVVIDLKGRAGHHDGCQGIPNHLSDPVPTSSACTIKSLDQLALRTTQEERQG
jgi:hypothetical protein